MEPVDRLPTEETRPRWRSIRLIYLREMRDQLRDRRTVFTIAVLPMLLYPLVGMLLMQIAQFGQQSEPRLGIVGARYLPEDTSLLVDEKLDPALINDVGPVKVQVDVPETTDANALAKSAEWIDTGIFDAVVIFPENLASGRSTTPVKLVYSVTNDRSVVARDRGEALLKKLRERWIRQGLEAAGIEISLLMPFQVEDTNIAPPAASQAAFWSKLLPFVMMIWALTGAFYPAIDLVAGEKERGTLETLLCSPAMRGEIVWGKLFAVATFSMATAILNVAGLELTMGFVSRQLSIGPLGAAGSPPLATLAWLMLGLIPLSGLFSALALSVAALARSSKEAQYYLMPLLMVLMPLVILPLLRGIELNIGTAIIPVTGMFLLVRSLVEGQYLFALAHLPFVAIVTGACCFAAVRWAKHQFESEQVLFRSDDQWTLTVWLKRMVQDREAVPSPAQSFGCALLVLMLLFFGRMAITQMPTTWQQIAVTVIAPQLGLVLFPVLLVATFFTTSIRTSLRVNAAPWLAFPTAILLAVLLHPAYVELAGLISHVYPLSEQAVKSLKEFDGLLGAPPFWQVCLVLAVIPALCEELCFRGFTMAGLLRMNRPYVAVAVTAFLFGMSHSILQQSLSATVMGLVIGVIAWRTGSVLPGILFHATHNSLSMWLGRLSSEQMTANRTELEGLWNYIARQTSEGVTYQPVWTLLSSALAIVTLYYFLTLRTKSSQTSSLGKSLSAAHSAFATPATR